MQDADTWLYVGNLPWNADEPMVRYAFAKIVHMQEVKFAIAKIEGVPEGRFMGYAFAKLDSKDDVAKAIVEMSGKEIGGRACFLDTFENEADLWVRAFGE
jgi:RNA recognition motif-containing protein